MKIGSSTSFGYIYKYINFIYLQFQHPVTWQPNANGTKLIGHMILKKTVKDGQGRDSSAILGLKVVGGKMTESGRLGAFITKVKKGSIADTVGHLKPGRYRGKARIYPVGGTRGTRLGATTVTRQM